MPEKPLFCSLVPSIFFVIQGGEGISHKAFHYVGHLGSGAGAQNTLGKEICSKSVCSKSDSSLFRADSAPGGLQSVDTRRKIDSELFMGVTEDLSIER